MEIKTKFNAGDTVYYIDDIVREETIDTIQIIIDEFDICITYMLSKDDDFYYTDDDLFSTFKEAYSYWESKFKNGKSTK